VSCTYVFVDVVVNQSVVSALASVFCLFQYFDLHKKIYDWFDIQFDFFGRTSCEEPATDTTWPQTQITQEIYFDLQRAGVIHDLSVDQGMWRVALWRVALVCL
jgi:hypothetical protein